MSFTGQVHSLAAGTIESVVAGSTGEDIGLRPGDRIVAVNGKALHDVIDFRFEIAGESAEIEVDTADGPVVLEVEKDYDDTLGVSFTEEVFDGVRTCRNACPFCFVRNLPGGMRASLYQKDDDYRLSFLHGNFVTLTNLTGDDFGRIASQRLSPLYISVHSTNPTIRARMLGCLSGDGRDVEDIKRADIMGPLATLADAGIRFHCQIVLVPGLNDGPDFEATLDDLAGLQPRTLSVGVVPVGLTAFCKAEGMRLLRVAEASGVLDRIEKWSNATGSRGLVFASDEMFLVAGRPVPDASYYGDYSQLENGIGMARLFLDGAIDLRPAPQAIEPARDVVIVTGEAFAPFMRAFAARYSGTRGLEVSVLAVPNRFFGSTVTVAGLLVGQDVASRLGDDARRKIVLLPASCLNDGRFLDDMAKDELGRLCGAAVVAVPPDPVALDRSITVGNGGGVFT
jgi:putative radical SAM enzyme (TIGR03279 family)